MTDTPAPTTEEPRPPKVLGPRQAAKLFGVGTDTINKWADAGLIPSFRTPNGYRRFHDTDLLAAIEASRPTPADKKAVG